MPTSPTMPESPRSLSAKEGCEPNSFLRVLPCADDRCFPRTSHRAIALSMLNTTLLELFPQHPSDSPPPSLRNPHVALCAITLSISLSLSTFPFKKHFPTTDIKYTSRFPPRHLTLSMPSTPLPAHSFYTVLTSNKISK